MPYDIKRERDTQKAAKIKSYIDHMVCRQSVYIAIRTNWSEDTEK